eukprot:410361-Pelagomonas_calceolata.AAC.1
MTRLVEGMGNIDSPTHTQKDCVESDLSTLKLFARLTVTVRCCCCVASSWAPGLESLQYLKNKNDYTSLVQLRASRKGPLTSKLARASPR